MFLQRINKKIAIVFALLILHQAIFPNVALALTGGPSQPEVESFKPIGATDMVDLFTGDFSYNIPLMDVDGYPINISYQSNPGMDDEASWVGLGWTLNPGVMNRDVRGFPDDFKGDDIKRDFSIRPNVTIGATTGFKAEILGFFRPRAGRGFFYNTYKGFGKEHYLGAAFALSKDCKPFELGINYNNNSQSGIDIDLDAGITAKDKSSFNLGLGINSRNGLKDLSWSATKKNLLKDTDASIGGSISFSQRTYFPASELPFINSSFTLDGTLGAEASPVHTGVNFQGYYTRQDLSFKSKTNRGYGYLYLQDGRSSKVEASALMDYNQEKVRAYRKDMPHIAIPYGTYDLYSASGQGVSGQFRAMRNDVGTFGGQKRKNLSNSSSAGVELGFGKDFRGGLNVRVAKSFSVGQEWKKLNRANGNMTYTSADRNYEPVFFKNTGENVPTESAFYNQLGTDNAVKVGVLPAGSEALAVARLDKEKNKQPQGSNTISANLKRNTREKRNQVFSYLTAKEAAAVGLSKQIQSHLFNTLTYPCPGTNVTNTNRTGGTYYKDHHISEISVTQGDGSRYVYGIPAYNKVHKEATFSVDKALAVTTPSNSNFGLVGYSPGGENSISNNKGRDNYFDQQQIAPYAYAHLLTSVLSADYADRTGDGITEDDPGNAVKLNYTKVRDNYPWRVPAQANMARYIEGRKADALDDKGTYLYGEKEIWFVHSIESRTMLAQFYISPRNDARGVAGENGGLGSLSNNSRKLDSIRLYSKSDLRLNGTNAVPIKTVRFTYDYSLCSGLPNNSLSAGKLTLLKIEFVYQKSGKGKLNPYRFTYATGANNPVYNMGLYDRWGGYQSNPSNHPNNLDFPYTLQNPSLLNPSAWNLTQITLPSGANINVEYEPDDYAYVQDKRAQKMSFIQGFSRDSAGLVTAPTRKLYHKINGNHEIYDYVVVGTDQINIAAYTATKIKKQFLEGVKNIYFNTGLILKGTNRERISGYMELDTGRDPKSLNGGLSLAIPIKKVTASNNKVTHPIGLAAFQTMRLELQDITYGAALNINTNNPNKFDMTKMLRQLLARKQSNELRALFSGFEQTAMNRDWAKDTDVGETTTDRSWVRLPDPDYIKYGGGSRVKKVTINDQWNIAQGGGASTYGQEYSYRMTDTGVSSSPISSGVAAYEPTLGGEENAMRQPLPYKEKILLAPSNHYYTETPLGESLYPAPVVGYRQVTVKNLVNANVSRTATGYSVVKFYTAKEFPVLTDFTNNQPYNVKSGALSRFFKLNAVDYVTVSQGFLVEVNDMHGKMREEAVYNESGALIRSTRYEYKVDDPKAERLHLNNLVSVVYPTGSIGTDLMGIDMDVWQDMQEDANETVAVGISANLDASFPFITSFTSIPTLQRENTRLRTAATTKFIKRFGILDKVIVNENGSVASTRNVLFDSETGNVLLTETQNEFNDNVYAFNYPAHWAYPGMGQAYKNISAIATNVQITNGAISGLSNPQDVLSEGDELLIIRANGTVEPQRYSISICNALNRVLDFNGNVANFGTETLSIKVLRSGKRNMASTSIGGVESLVNPASGSNLVFTNQSKVINASSQTFKDDWAMFCQRHPNYSWLYLQGPSINPFANGRKGNWRPNKAYTFFNDRDQTITTASLNRSNGIVNAFSPFWTYNTTSQLWVANVNAPWTLSKEVSMYDFRGNALETKNAIDVYASSQYGYNHTRVLAIADNAAYRDMAYDGFEDYSFNNAKSTFTCFVNPDQGVLRKVIFGYNPLTTSYQGINLDSTYAHTGKFSIKVNGSSSSIARIAQSPVLCQVPNASIVSSASAVEKSTLSPDCPILDFNCTNCLPQTSLSGGTSNEYLVSAWVSTNNSILNGGALPSNIGIEIERVNSLNQSTVATEPLFNPVGPIVDGWQRIEAKITIPSGQDMLVKLKNGSTSTVYFDDFRFHPFRSNMKSFVYDNFTMRLIAELDENNYAMYYEYDDEGRLIRVKKETEKGVMTVKEARTNLKAN
jgi:hypothetical protein